MSYNRSTALPQVKSLDISKNRLYNNNNTNRDSYYQRYNNNTSPNISSDSTLKLSLEFEEITERPRSSNYYNNNETNQNQNHNNSRIPLKREVVSARREPLVYAPKPNIHNNTTNRNNNYDNYEYTVSEEDYPINYNNNNVNKTKTTKPTTTTHTNINRKAPPLPNTNHNHNNTTISNNNNNNTVPSLPPSLPHKEQSLWLAALESTVEQIYMKLGWFVLPPITNYNNTNNSKNNKQDDGSQPALEDPASASQFLTLLKTYFSFNTKKENHNNDEIDVELLETVLINVLWGVVYNAVLYCTSSLDTRRFRTINNNPNNDGLYTAEREVRSGGAEDQYELVYDEPNKNVFEYTLSDTLPVRMTWKDAIYIDPEPSEDNNNNDNNLENENNINNNIFSRRRRSAVHAPHLHNNPNNINYILTHIYQGRPSSGAVITVLDYYFTLRCLTQLGYRRDTFYSLTPFFHFHNHNNNNNAPNVVCELLLVLLWLSKRYQLIAVVEWVEINRCYRYLMTRHVAASYYHQQEEEEEEPAGKKEKSEKSEVEKNGERLLYSLGQAYVWPPLSFREEEVIQDRLAQIDRLLGPENNNNENPKKGSDITRRLLSTKRLIQLSFNRLQHALHRKNTLPTLFPGFHQSSVVDTQLCLPAYDAYYKQAMEALEYGGKLGERWKERTGQLRAAGDLIAYCIQYNQEKNQNRNDKSLLSVSQEEIVRGLEEDDATWLNHNETEKQKFKNKSERSRAAVEKGKLRDSLLFHNNNKEDKTLSLSTILAEFRVTRFTSRIKDVWRSLWRQAQLERDVTDENTNEDDFLENPVAQRMMREKVEDNIRNRYSLHAALASEIFILQCEAYEKEEKIKESELLLLEKQRKSEHAALSAYQPKKANKVSIPPKKETVQKKNRPPPPPSLLHCMPFEFACSKIAKEYNMELKNNNIRNTIWPSKNMHYMEVGPSPTDLDHRATTAAIEIDRLMPLLYELQNTCNENYKLRSQRAHTALSELAQVYDLRVASPQPKKNASLSSK